MQNIPNEVSYENQTYYLEQYFISQVLDLEGLARFDVRDVRWTEKELTLSLKKAVIKEGSGITEDGEYGHFLYYDTWWENFKAKQVLPYIKKLGLEKTWLRDFFSYKVSTHSYLTLLNQHRHYWTLVIAPPNVNVYQRAKLHEILVQKLEK